MKRVAHGDRQVGDAIHSRLPDQPHFWCLFFAFRRDRIQFPEGWWDMVSNQE